MRTRSRSMGTHVGAAASDAEITSPVHHGTPPLHRAEVISQWRLDSPRARPPLLRASRRLIVRDLTDHGSGAIATSGGTAIVNVARASPGGSVRLRARAQTAWSSVDRCVLPPPAWVGSERDRVGTSAPCWSVAGSLTGALPLKPRRALPGPARVPTLEPGHGGGAMNDKMKRPSRSLSAELSCGVTPCPQLRQLGRGVVGA